MPLPQVQPIIPTSRKEPFDAPGWLFEFKYDGFRALCHLERGRHRLVSRRGNILDRFGALCDQLAAELDVDEAILDGEVIAADETGRPRFYDLLRRAKTPNGADLRYLPLSERRRRLQSVLPKRSSLISEALAVEGRGREFFELMCAYDLEGIVAKRLDEPYEPRTRWLKIKNPDYSEKERRGDLFNSPLRAKVRRRR
jgi:bifunctional non-homologous end joining protein LigD